LAIVLSTDCCWTACVCNCTASHMHWRERAEGSLTDSRLAENGQAGRSRMTWHYLSGSPEQTRHVGKTAIRTNYFRGADRALDTNIEEALAIIGWISGARSQRRKRDDPSGSTSLKYRWKTGSELVLLHRLPRSH